MKVFRHLYVQVLVAVILGALVGIFAPTWGLQLQWLGTAFIKLVRMLIAPIIFSTIVLGIGGMRDLRQVGRLGVKALIYFEVLTTVALAIGLIVVNWVQPGAGIHADAAKLDASSVAGFQKDAAHLSVVGFLLNVIPDTFLGAFTSGEILQVLLVALLCGIAAAQLGDRVRPALETLESIFRILMAVVGVIMKLAPLAAFGAIAFAVAKFGVESLTSLLKLMGCVYATMLVFILVVLGGVLRIVGFRLWAFLRYLREEILLVLGTSSSESALPGMLDKLERLGCSKTVVGLVLPAGYSFNLDGTCIYLTMASVFVAQATDTPLTLAQQLGMLAVLLLTSKGAAAVTGGGFVTLSATLRATHTVPEAGLSLLVGVDRFMSEARAITNLIGNGVAVVALAAWEGELDRERAHATLARPADEPASAGFDSAAARD
ncbi:MAG TPA: C4-dicarboxylate transporter DctA [Candidatus Didemnitutus sp.]|nr:C4-dicarboxylate transporter DctA [Candidatus Didemnitutus sp.]